MNVADAGSQEIDAQICDALALVRICALALCQLTPSSSPPMAPTSASREMPLLVAYLYEFFGLRYILLNWIVKNHRT